MRRRGDVESSGAGAAGAAVDFRLWWTCAVRGRFACGDGVDDSVGVGISMAVPVVVEEALGGCKGCS